MQYGSIAWRTTPHHISTTPHTHTHTCTYVRNVFLIHHISTQFDCTCTHVQHTTYIVHSRAGQIKNIDKLDRGKEWQEKGMKEGKLTATKLVCFASLTVTKAWTSSINFCFSSSSKCMYHLARRVLPARF